MKRTPSQWANKETLKWIIVKMPNHNHKSKTHTNIKFYMEKSSIWRENHMTSPIELTMEIEEYDVLRAQGVTSNQEDIQSYPFYDYTKPTFLTQITLNLVYFNDDHDGCWAKKTVFNLSSKKPKNLALLFLFLKLEKEWSFSSNFTLTFSVRLSFFNDLFHFIFHSKTKVLEAQLRC